GVPERYGSLVTVNNGSAIGYDAVLTGSDVDNAEWWATWEIALTRTGTFENVYLTVESELNYDDDRTYVYAFDLPDGWAPIRTENTDFLLEFMENGYNVSEGNGTGMGTVAVDVSNDDAAPVATFTVDNMVNGTVNESVAVELNATLSGDTGTNQSGIVMYVWDFGDGEMANLTGPETSHTYDIPGEYEIVLRVVDRANRTSAGHTMLLTVADITPPEVTLWFPEVVDVEGRGEVINLTGPNGVNATIVVNVTDADAVDTGYAVLLQVRAKDIEDANWTNQSWEAAVTAGENLTHTFHQILLTPGNQTVRVTVTDDAGNEATATGSILVWDMIPPVAEITVEDATLNAINLTELKENEEFVFNASGSTDNSRLLMVLWEFGDGTVDEDKNDKTDIGDLNEIVKHVYHAPGIYQVNATVVDDWGNSAEATVNVSVLDNVAPEAKFTTWVNGSQGSHVHEETEMIVFNATESSDTSGVIAYYSWDFGDNVTVNGTEAVVNHTYQDPGTMTVNLTIGDGAGHWDRISKTVTVVALDKPDFTVDIQEDEIDTNIKEGDRARIVVKVFNKGEVDLADGETVKVALLVVRTVPVEKTEDNRTIVVSEERTEEVASELIDGLAVNENKTVVLTWKPKHGSYRLRVIVDPDNGW
ncbi:MAG TPA: PKD domain-containing protein, partial [Thermoplasmata archaeon]|nr:PKD domain-containing protein [Thermoplasmata archaeon]